MNGAASYHTPEVASDEKQCTSCGRVLPRDQFVQKECRRLGTCRPCRNAYLREYNRTYTKTKFGFLMRVYRNMLSRVSGVQAKKAHLYLGLALLPRETFYRWAEANQTFHRLFAEWEQRGYRRTHTPTVDRIDSSRGYEIENMEWVTHSENSRRGAIALNKKVAASKRAAKQARL